MNDEKAVISDGIVALDDLIEGFRVGSFEFKEKVDGARSSIWEPLMGGDGI